MSEERAKKFTAADFTKPYMAHGLWNWRDERGCQHGPYASEQEAQDIMDCYCDLLRDEGEL